MYYICYLLYLYFSKDIIIIKQYQWQSNNFTNIYYVFEGLGISITKLNIFYKNRIYLYLYIYLYNGTL